MDEKIWIDEKLGYCVITDKNEKEIKNYLIDKIVNFNINECNNWFMRIDGFDGLKKFRKTHMKKYNIKELQEIIEFNEYYKKRKSEEKLNDLEN
jgi:hypothetical protein